MLNPYTNGIDIISVLLKVKFGYLVKDTKQKTTILSDLKGYRRIGDDSSIKE